MSHIDRISTLYVHLETITAYFEKRSIGNYFLILESGFFLETINRKINKQIGKDINTVIGIYFIYNLNQKNPLSSLLKSYNFCTSISAGP